jgi:Flp pilus assembly protein TadD
VVVGSHDPRNHLNLALANYNARDAETAVRVMQNGLQYAGNMPEYHEKYAALCLATGNIDLGLEVSNNGLELFPNNQKLLDYRMQLNVRKSVMNR